MIELHWQEFTAYCPYPGVGATWAAEAWGGELLFTILHFDDDGWMAVARTHGPCRMVHAADNLAEAQAACLEFVKRRSF